jgi:hypothetical protein
MAPGADAILAALKDTANDYIYFPPGTYRISKSITISKPIVAGECHASAGTRLRRLPLWEQHAACTLPVMPAVPGSPELAARLLWGCFSTVQQRCAALPGTLSLAVGALQGCKLCSVWTGASR